MKHIRNISIFILAFLLIHTAYAQNEIETVAKGVGIKREDALQDALRNAISQAVGVSLTSETKVENYAIISDAISTNSSGYIKSYQVQNETPFPDRFEIMVKAQVTTESMKADFNMLSKAVGGVRFLVVYDSRQIQDDQKPYYDLAVDKMNEYLSTKSYRYIERKQFETLRSEAFKILESDNSEISYVQQLGLMSGAQFIINISNLIADRKSEQFDTRTSAKISMQVKAYDNCTAEGLGTMVFESSRNSSADAASIFGTGISEAVNKNADQLIGRFITYIGNWVNNGTPYELRFYNVGTYRDFRDLKGKMKEISQFGGDMEIVSVNNYTKLNCTFKKKPDELADKVLDLADQIPALKDKVLDIKLIYGRQINFAPRNAIVPQLQVVESTGEKTSAKTLPNSETEKSGLPSANKGLGQKVENSTQAGNTKSSFGIAQKNAIKTKTKKTSAKTKIR